MPADSRLDEILTAYLEAVDAGWAPPRATLVDRYPDYKTELESFFAEHDGVAATAGAITPDGAAALCDPSLLGDGAESGMLPRAFGSYELLSLLACGGMGIVYKARQSGLDRIVALKMILGGALASADDVRRFRNEAEASAQLDHPHIVPIYEVGEVNGQPYFTMKLIEGGTLAENRAPFRDPREAARLIVTVARAVGYAHQRGILHRDLKPANILLNESGQPLVSDFGLARRLAADSKLTRSGAIVGTPNYMAPEQATGKVGELTTATDVWALGAILYESLTGQPPFAADTALDTLVKLRQDTVAPVRAHNPRIDADLEAVCLRCLERDPSRRYASAALLADDLQAWLDGKPTQARPMTTTTRFVKWVRRHPGTAGLVGLFALVVLLASFGLGAVLQLRQTEAERDRARDEWKQANKSREEAHSQFRAATERERQAKTVGYAFRMSQASRQWRENRSPRVRSLLDSCAAEHRHWEWYYHDRLLTTKPHQLKDSKVKAEDLVYSSDGKKILAICEDSTLRIWDARSGALMSSERLQGIESIYAAAFSLDGRHLAVAPPQRGFPPSAPLRVHVFNLKTGNQECLELPIEEGDWGCLGPGNLAISHDGKRLATTTSAFKENRRCYRVWDVQTKTALLKKWVKGHAAHVALNGDGTLLAMSCMNTSPDDRHTTQLWSVNNEGQLLRELAADLHTRLTFSPDGKRVAGHSDGKVSLWKVDSGSPLIYELPGRCSWRSKILFSPDSQRLMAGALNGTVQIWDLHEGLAPSLFRSGDPHYTCGCFSPDGKSLAVTFQDGPIHVWDTTENPECDVLTTRCYGMSLSADCRLVSGYTLLDGLDQLQVWELGTRQRTWSSRPARKITSFSRTCLSPDGKVVAVGHSDGPSIELWDVGSGKARHVLPGHDGGTAFMAFTPDGQSLLSGGHDDIRLWDVVTGARRWQFEGHKGAVRGIAVRPDGRRVASVAVDGLVKVWDLASKRELLSLSGLKGWNNAVAFSPDGKWVASRGPDGTIYVWDCASGTRTMTLEGIAGEVSAITFSPDGRRLAAGTRGEFRSNQIVLWDPTTGEEMWANREVPTDVDQITFTPDGHKLVTLGGWQVRVYDGSPVKRR